VLLVNAYSENSGGASHNRANHRPNYQMPGASLKKISNHESTQIGPTATEEVLATLRLAAQGVTATRAIAQSRSST
jgi:hypothetical protein